MARRVVLAFARTYVMASSYLGACWGAYQALKCCPKEEKYGKATLDFAAGMVSGPFLIPVRLWTGEWPEASVTRRNP